MSKYSLKLFIEGQKSNSIRAIDNLVRFCEKHLPKKYTLDVIDILKDPAIAKMYRVVDTPALIKESPKPVQKLIGDLSDYEKLLASLLTIDPTII